MDLIENYESGSEEEHEVIKTKSRKSYTTEFKLKVINFAMSVGGSNHSAGKKFGVDRNTVRDWLKQEGKLNVIKNTSPAGKSNRRLRGGGKKITFKDLDDQLAIWVRERRSRKLRVSRETIQRQASRMFNAEEDVTEFKVSIEKPWPSCW